MPPDTEARKPSATARRIRGDSSVTLGPHLPAHARHEQRGPQQAPDGGEEHELRAPDHQQQAAERGPANEPMLSTALATTFAAVSSSGVLVIDGSSAHSAGRKADAAIPARLTRISTTATGASVAIASARARA